ncbi:MAG: hypothetical protein QNK55_03165 [Saprospiraceae bacterium]
MIDKQFEDILKRKLNNMTDYSNIDWSVFEHKLDKAQMSNTASEGDFDSSIKQKLTGITTASLGSDWSIFEQMLNEDQFTDDMLDDKVSEEMNKMRPPYRHDHWEMLHKSLEFKRQRNNNIIGFKVIELSLLFMLLLSANNLYKYLPSTFEVEKPMIYASLDDNIQNSTRKPVSETLKTKAITQKKSIVSSSVSRATNKEIITTPTTVKNTNLITTITSASENNNSEVTLTTPLSSYILVSPITDVTSDVEASQKAYILSKASGLINVAAISMREMSNLSSDQPYIHKSIDIAARYTTHILYPSTNTEKSIFVYVGLDNNLVNSPFDDVYDTEGYRTFGIGYSAGVEYNVKKGKKEFSLGLGYSNRAYEPRIIEELTGNPALTLYETSLDNIEFNIMSLSVGLKYIMAESDNWTLDFGFGTSANVVVNSNYSIETLISRDGQPVSTSYGRQPFSDLNEKPLHDGIFENGSLKENIYMTTDVSFGLHRQLSERTTFTLRPEYSVHSFSNGIGPNNDLINNLSLNLGVRYIL